MSWYKVERGWLDNAFFQNAEYSERDAWQWMIGEAAFEDSRISVNGKPFELSRGQLYASIRFMAQKFGWSVNRVVRFLERLREWGMVNTATDTGQNLITICNYSKYQDRKIPSDTATDTETNTAADTPSDTATDTNSKNLIPSRTQEVFCSSPAAPPMADAKPEKQKRGERLEAYLDREGVDPTAKAWGEWALAEGLPLQSINSVMADFRDWWRAAPAGKGVKADWPATWRGWVRREIAKLKEKEKRDEIFKRRNPR